MGREGTGKGFPRAFVLDAGALIAFERGDAKVYSLVKRGTLTGSLTIPASALAQTWRGGPRSAMLARLIEAGEVDALDEERAKEIGVRLGNRNASDIADAHAVCCALEQRAAIATSDPGDIGALAEAGESLALIPV